jgi:hypothetical protein
MPIPTSVSDLFVQSFLGWQAGNLHGWDLSATAGFTFNETNAATDYKTGDEFHLEWAVTKYLSKQFTIGVVGYYYQQLTPDTGTGAVLGSFEGRVVARRRHWLHV